MATWYTYYLHTDHDTPFTLYPFPRYLGERDTLLCACFLSAGTLFVAWMREFVVSRKTSMLKFLHFPSIDMFWITGILTSKAVQRIDSLVPKNDSQDLIHLLTTTTNISLWLAKNCQWVNNLVERWHITRWVEASELHL